MQSTTDTARSVNDYANGQVNHFLDNVEDLTKALKDIETMMPQQPVADEHDTRTFRRAGTFPSRDRNDRGPAAAAAIEEVPEEAAIDKI